MNTLEFYFDFADPFSYIAGKRFIDYIDANGISVDSINFRSFQLKPNDTNKNLNFLESQVLVSQYNSIEEFVEYFNETIGKEALSSGLTINVESIINSNSVHAHAGMHFTKKFGKHLDFFLRVMHDHYANGSNYYDLDYIKSVLVDLGLETSVFEENLKELKRQVSLDRFEGLKIGLQVVPSFFIKDNLAFMGMGSKRAFDEAFSKLVKPNTESIAKK